MDRGWFERQRKRVAKDIKQLPNWFRSPALISERAATRQRAPVKNDSACIQDLVIRDIEARKAVGFRRYGTLLQPFNGRDALMDAYQEALDLCQYLRQAVEERDSAQGNSAPGAAGGR